MIRFCSLSSGSSGNCYYLYTENDSLMIDAGLGIRAIKKCFREYGFSLAKVGNILVTHDHADHVKAVGLVCRDFHTNVYATRLVHEGIANNYCVRAKIAVEHQRLVEKGVPFTLGDFRITPFGVPHDSCDNVGYRIECGGVSFCLMTDAGSLTEEMASMIGDTDYLVIEANYDEEMLAGGPYPQHLKVRIAGQRGHMSNRDCAKAIAENATSRLKRVWLCHLSEENNHPELARKTVEQVLRSYGIVAGKDFALEVLKRKVPSGVYELV